MVFLVAVIGIAVLFRAGIGLLRPAAPEPEAAPVFATATATAARTVAVPAASAEAEPRTKAHPVDPPTVGSGRMRPEPPRRRTRPAR